MTPRPRNHRRPLRAAALAGIALTLTSVAAACGAGPAPQSAAHQGAIRHMIADDGHRIAFYVTPGRQPAIVLDSGGGEDHTEWNAVAPALARTTGAEIITYDRAGMGGSDEVAGPWKVSNAVSDLEAGLTTLGATHGVVLVAHSEGAEIATTLAHDHPGEVKSAVLVDPSVPQFYTSTEIARIEAATRPQLDALANSPSTRQTRQLQAVAADYGPWHRAYHQRTWPSGVPVTVLGSAATPFSTSPADAAAWRNALRAFVHAAPDRRLVVVPHSTHEIPTDHPDAVIRQVQDMVRRVG